MVPGYRTRAYFQINYPNDADTLQLMLDLHLTNRGSFQFSRTLVLRHKGLSGSRHYRASLGSLCDTPYHWTPDLFMSFPHLLHRAALCRDSGVAGRSDNQTNTYSVYGLLIIKILVNRWLRPAPKESHQDSIPVIREETHHKEFYFAECMPQDEQDH